MQLQPAMTSIFRRRTKGVATRNQRLEHVDMNCAPAFDRASSLIDFEGVA
jgi:hypothetical protein